ncbi:Serine threonine kinase [Olea europaea subsp. europaea]|uniref:Serine threonine kinase n=1 Tax=Olea europaea subsp. europaea TaxID=158383 RepID=A0A8S0RRW8_OLEEU|nr:Serine threonine kinase [Olea europaea subsp. europaea]
MELHLLQTQFILPILLVYFSISISSSTSDVNSTIARPNCMNHCGDIKIPFPFGTTPDCSFNKAFLVNCTDEFNPPKVFLRRSNVEIVNISLDGQLWILNYIAKACYVQTQNGIRIRNSKPHMQLSRPLTVSNTANKFTVIGCDTNATVYGYRLNQKEYRTGCNSWCKSEDDLEDGEGSCSGLGCCQIPIPKEVSTVDVTLRIRHRQNSTNVRDFNNCSYAFLVEEGAFPFSSGTLSSLRNVTKLPVVVDWSIGNGTCEEAQKNKSSYACKSKKSTCEKHDNGYGYRCSCQDGYQGNPYIIEGCQDINECENPSLNNCEEGRCVNTEESFKCVCPKGYNGDGKKDGRGCIRGQSLVLKLVAGIAIGVSALLLAACWLYLELNRRKLIGMKQKFFLQNGGLLLQEQLTRKEKSPDMAKIFSSSELKKATNDFHDCRIIGQGGFGTVYKGFLSDNRIVAIKKSKEASALSWDNRLRIATEAAGVLAYLHSAASPPIIHRDVKSANILLDSSYTAKVSDFGASRLVPLDQTQLSTMVQGTFGYLVLQPTFLSNPEYMQTNQLTEKSDVYSFGVVLVELLTGKKALSYDRPEEERNLASYFLSTLKQGRLFQILDDNNICEGNSEQLIAVSMLVRRCLHVKGEDRPRMKEVAMELEGLRLSARHSWEQIEPYAEEKESLLSVEMNTLANGEGNSARTGFDSIRDHITLPMGGAR